VGNIAENLARIRRRMADAAARAGRDENSVRLVAVSKTKPVAMMKEAIQAGVRILGENYVQEAIPKIEAIGPEVQFHFIGHLQSKKARQVVPHFSMIHSVDSIKLAEEISKRSLAMGKVMDILIQVNVAGEESKFGIRPEELRPLLEEIASLEGAAVKGLMTMPPYFDQPERVRPFFRVLRELAGSLEGAVKGVTLKELSMGMSGDFEVAIEEGATLVRVGTSIFGERE
jgi:PLP dependent protein